MRFLNVSWLLFVTAVLFGDVVSLLRFGRDGGKVEHMQTIPETSVGDGGADKPRLVFFQSKYGKNVPNFMVRHRDEHVRCLRRQFDVTLVNYDCDYQQVCEEVNANIALFETGVSTPGCNRVKVSNVHGLQKVPRVALLNADAWSETREGILSETDRWGIEVFFSISVIAAEHTPVLADRLFVWPNFIEQNVFRDYGDPKIIPIMISGAQHPQYPWRHRVFAQLSNHFPCFICPHGGYQGHKATRQMLDGEPYARAISASFFAPTCGTVANEVVRKHFEIPACRTCLITEACEGLRAAGFVDMQNCIFADERDVVEKVAHLLEHRDELERLCDAGHELVTTRHTAQYRNQIHRWFTLHRNIKPGERIVQTGPFDTLTIVSRDSNAQNQHVISRGRHLQLLQEGDGAFAVNSYQAAEKAYEGCLSYFQLFPEAKLKLALCKLHLGDPLSALRCIIGPIRYTLSYYHAEDPDPVEWAYLIISLLCAGRLREAQRRAHQFSYLHHPELDRARAVAYALCANMWLDKSLGPAPSRKSIHILPFRSLDDWVGDIACMLEACRQSDMSRRLRVMRFNSAASALGRLSWRQNLAQVVRIPVFMFQRRPTLRYLDNPLLAEASFTRVVALYGWIRRLLQRSGRPSAGRSNSYP